MAANRLRPNKRLLRYGEEADLLAAWFVTQVLREPWDDFRHEHQVKAAASLLGQGYTTDQVQGAVRAAVAGELEVARYERVPIFSLAFLTFKTVVEGKGVCTPMTEYLHAEKLKAYRARPEALEALRAREGSFFAVAQMIG